MMMHGLTNFKMRELFRIFSLVGIFLTSEEAVNRQHHALISILFFLYRKDSSLELKQSN